jgi:hypothetical protein
MVVDKKQQQFGRKIEAYLKPSWVLASTKNETDTPWLDILSVNTLKLEVVGDKRNTCPYPH